MNMLNRFIRITHIGFILIKHGLDEFIIEIPIFRPLRFLSFFIAIFWKRQKLKSRGMRLREALEELGPIFVKFGQVLSTRYDLLPEDIVKELTLLQDQVPPFPGDIAKKMIEASLESPIDNLFQSFDLKPLASASIAQVHSAILLEGRAVVVKVLRPHIHEHIQRDVDLMHTLAKIAQKYWQKIRPFKPQEMVTELERTLIDELDLVREAANASQLRRNFANSHLLYIPEIIWKYSKSDVLVMEKVQGISISDRHRLQAEGFDLKQLAERLIEIFFIQAFRDCFFHADMHPGNILISTKNPQNPQYIAMDFGIMGMLSPADQFYLAENLLAFLKRNYRRVAELHRESGWIPKTTRLDTFESAIRTVCEPMFERPLKEVSFGELLLRLFQIASRYQVNIQPQLILLQKTLMNIEGLSRQLYPDIDLWATARPYLETWMKKEMGVNSFLRKLKSHAPFWIERLKTFALDPT